VKEMSYEKTPDMSVAKAIRASMSLPILYTPVKDGDSLLVDGGLLHNLPLAFLKEEEIFLLTFAKKYQMRLILKRIWKWWKSG
jgi:NTE family protein